MRTRTSVVTPSPASTTQDSPTLRPSTPRRVDSAELMDGERVLEIVHLGVVYRLQTTRFGKLILTK
jgi:hemin uptake protein HemP